MEGLLEEMKSGGIEFDEETLALLREVREVWLESNSTGEQRTTDIE